MKLLYCFISHKSVVEQDAKKWRQVCKDKNIVDYLIICGGYKKNYIKDNILHLNCNDYYEGLSFKIHSMFKFFIENNINFDYYLKIDRDVKLFKPIDDQVQLKDYSGCWVKVKQGFDGNRKWHFGKCSKNSRWSSKEYPGKFIPWCDGGRGYFLSPKAATIIASNPPDENVHIYEDLYVAETLLKYDIHPQHIYNIKEYLLNIEEK